MKLPGRGNGGAGTGPVAVGLQSPFCSRVGQETWSAQMDTAGRQRAPQRGPKAPRGKTSLLRDAVTSPFQGSVRGPPAIPALPMGPHGALTSPGNRPQPPQPGLPPKVNHGIGLGSCHSTPGINAREVRRGPQVEPSTRVFRAVPSPGARRRVSG